MGNCYSVSAKLTYKNKERALNAIRSIVAEKFFDNAIADDEEQCMKALLPNAFLQDGIWEADFDASYSWEEVLRNAFTEVLKECKSGSFAEVNPDNYYWRLEVSENGIIHETTGITYADSMEVYENHPIFRIYEEAGVKRIQFLAYGYDSHEKDPGFRFVEYIGFDVPLSAALEYGNVDLYESDHGDAYKQTMTDVTEEECIALYEEYDNGLCPQYIGNDQINQDIPNGMYILINEKEV